VGVRHTRVDRALDTAAAVHVMRDTLGQANFVASSPCPRASWRLNGAVPGGAVECTDAAS